MHQEAVVKKRELEGSKTRTIHYRESTFQHKQTTLQGSSTNQKTKHWCRCCQCKKHAKVSSLHSISMSKRLELADDWHDDASDLEETRLEKTMGKSVPLWFKLKVIILHRKIGPDLLWILLLALAMIVSPWLVAFTLLDCFNRIGVLKTVLLAVTKPYKLLLATLVRGLLLYYHKSVQITSMFLNSSLSSKVIMCNSICRY